MNIKKMAEDKNDEIKATYDRVFSDEAIADEQLEMTREFESSGKDEGQEW